MKNSKQFKPVRGYAKYVRSRGCETWKGKAGCFHDADRRCEHACHLRLISPLPARGKKPTKKKK